MTRVRSVTERQADAAQLRDEDGDRWLIRLRNGREMMRVLPDPSLPTQILARLRAARLRVEGYHCRPDKRPVPLITR